MALQRLLRNAEQFAADDIVFDEFRQRTDVALRWFESSKCNGERHAD